MNSQMSGEDPDNELFQTPSGVQGEESGGGAQSVKSVPKLSILVQI